MKILPDPVSFEWDEGNIDKNLIKHKVTNKEAEETFGNEPKIIAEDIKQSAQERRFQLFGYTNNNRKLAVIFTVRKNKVRVISARTMNSKERRYYEDKIKSDT